jgi:hypothetical protein
MVLVTLGLAAVADQVNKLVEILVMAVLAAAVVEVVPKQQQKVLVVRATTLVETALHL